MLDITYTSLKEVFGPINRDLERSAMKAMRAATVQTKQDLREQITSNGLGNRLANTWRSDVYPGSGKTSLNPAGYVWSQAPDIVDAFSRGTLILPLNGRKYLWIPTRNVPRARGAGRATSTKRMTPPQVEQHFNADFIFRPGKAGRLLAMIAVARGATPTGRLRKTRKGRTAYGASDELVLMFTLVRSARAPRLLDLHGPAQRGAARFETEFYADF